jgi:hypothetical protein
MYSSNTTLELLNIKHKLTFSTPVWIAENDCNFIEYPI